MKIIIKEDGSLIIDGENDTVVGVDFNKTKFDVLDAIKIKGGKKDAKYEVKNITFKHTGGCLSCNCICKEGYTENIKLKQQN